MEEKFILIYEVYCEDKYYSHTEIAFTNKEAAEKYIAARKKQDPECEFSIHTWKIPTDYDDSLIEMYNKRNK